MSEIVGSISRQMDPDAFLMPPLGAAQSPLGLLVWGLPDLDPPFLDYSFSALGGIAPVGSQTLRLG